MSSGYLALQQRDALFPRRLPLTPRRPSASTTVLVFSRRYWLQRSSNMNTVSLRCLRDRTVQRRQRHRFCAPFADMQHFSLTCSDAPAFPQHSLVFFGMAGAPFLRPATCCLPLSSAGIRTRRRAYVVRSGLATCGWQSKCLLAAMVPHSVAEQSTGTRNTTCGDGGGRGHSCLLNGRHEQWAARPRGAGVATPLLWDISALGGCALSSDMAEPVGTRQRYMVKSQACRRQRHAAPPPSPYLVALTGVGFINRATVKRRRRNGCGVFAAGDMLILPRLLDPVMESGDNRGPLHL